MLKGSINMARTPAQVKEEIAALQKIAASPKFRHSTAFGDDNDAAIESQIEVLQERLTNDDVADREDSEQYDEHTASIARAAATWLAGESNEVPSKGWEGLY